ncbi:Nucleotide-binding universal stress protein, UspA family [Methanobrevibacter olleyae]|uniref:Nucleotide-binding universal stress protein, UspA family n=1 Tax=Methanobrevibacter olleyae TaxID=294671 RepID=A0A1I4GW91_METOL|nr:universal stress protein [Methanobrevibacter olleyae]SFL34342.1 Nucleotide-binding universal stress protein, UspA family [Methanobrevibacter olleyae]
MVEQLYKKILLPTDGSKYSDQSEKHALAIADVNDAEIIALSVIENSFFINLPDSETVSEVNNLLKKETEKNLNKVERLRDEECLDVKITKKVAEGSPARVILETIEEEDIDLVVIGSSGKTGIDKFLMGSVAEKVVKSAKCCVLVVH